MSLDPLVLILAAAFASGCATVHARRLRADAVMLVLSVVAYGLATAVVSLLAARFGLVMVPDHPGGWMFVAASQG